MKVAAALKLSVKVNRELLTRGIDVQKNDIFTLINEYCIISLIIQFME